MPKGPNDSQDTHDDNNPIDDDVQATLNSGAGPDNKDSDDDQTKRPSGDMKDSLKVYDQEQEYTYEEIKRFAQKGLAADQKFRDAETQAKQNEEAIKGWEALKSAASNEDPEALRSVMELMGAKPADIEAALENAFGEDFAVSDDDAGDSGKKGGGKDASDDTAPPWLTPDMWNAMARAVNALIHKRVSLSDLDPDLKGTLEPVGVRTKREKVEFALDRDPELGYNEYGDEQKQRLVDAVLHEAEQATKAAGRPFGDGTHVLPGAISHVKSLLSSLAPQKGRTPPMGLPPAPGRSGAEVHQKPKRVSTSDPNYEDNVLEQIAFHIGRK